MQAASDLIEMILNGMEEIELFLVRDMLQWRCMLQ